MALSLTEVLGALILLGIAIALVFAYRKYLAANSERRMQAMLEKVGLDPAIASSGDTRTIMKEVRDRCRHCQTEDVCERWLKGEEAGDNDFCPNHRVFEMLHKYGGATG